MSKEATLERIEADITAGNFGKARDRLHGLIGSFPDDIALRSRLADIYSRLHYPEMAGCYWYLEEDKTDQIELAVCTFKKRCGSDPWIMLHSIKFRGDIETLPLYAKQRLNQLIAECKTKYGTYPDFQSRKTTYIHTTKQNISSGISVIAFSVALVFFIICMIIGFGTIVRWVFQEYQQVDSFGPR